MLKVCMLVSGGLGLTILRHLFPKQNIVAVFTDKQSQGIIDFCEQNYVPVFAGNPRLNDTSAFRSTIECDVLLSVNYLFIIGEEMIRLPRQTAINIHGSLLPKYRGRTPHVWAIINGESKTGITAHLIDDGVDTGAIVHQIEVPIEAGDTGAGILEKYASRYPQMADEVLEKIANNRLIATPQDETKATYFGKRTPEDGKILWQWHKERIRNWIRAQAAPYPGAFTYFSNNRITINKAEYDDLGFNHSQPDGTVLQTGNDFMLVKTPNGALRLSDYTIENNAAIKAGDILA